MIVKLVGISDIQEANRFLRALWAELRIQFPGCAWHFNPSKMGDHPTYIGELSIGSESGSLQIAMTYKMRGSIEHITFDQLPPAKIDEGSELGASLSLAVDKALERSPNPRIRTTTGWIEPLQFPLCNYTGKSFKIVRLSGQVSSITMPVRGYDDRDADLEFYRKINNCMDLLAVETETPFWEVRRPSEERPDPLALNDVFVNNPNWQDDLPITKGQLVISPEAKNFVDFLAEDNVGGLEKAQLLQAARLYHAAIKLKAHLGQHRKIMGPDLPAICSVLFLSSLEVVSSIGMSKPKQCKECGQTLYGIRQRVGDIVAKFHPIPPKGTTAIMPKEGGCYYVDERTGGMIDAGTAEAAREFGPNPLVKKLLTKAYDERSKFLHVGEPITDHTYSWFDCIPQLDASDPTGFNTSSIDSTYGMGKFVGHCLRQVLKEYINGLGKSDTGADAKAALK